MEDYKYLDYFEIEDGMDMEITIKFSNFLEVKEKVDGETITLYFLEDGQPGTYLCKDSYRNGRNTPHWSLKIGNQ